MKKAFIIFLVAILISFGIIGIYRILYSETDSIEFKLFSFEHGYYLNKLIGKIPTEYKKRIIIIDVDKGVDYNLYKISNKDWDECFYYIKFSNKKDGFIKGFMGDPSKGNGEYLSESVNLNLFNDYINAVKIKSQDSIQSKFLDFLKESSDTLAFNRIKNVAQIRFYLRGTNLHIRHSQDTINLAKLDISFDKEFVYWFRYSGFFRFHFDFDKNNHLIKVDSKEIGILDSRLLKI